MNRSEELSRLRFSYKKRGEYIEALEDDILKLLAVMDAARRFRDERGKHEGEHEFQRVEVAPAGPLGPGGLAIAPYSSCIKCDQAYLACEAEFDAAVAAFEAPP